MHKLLNTFPVPYMLHIFKINLTLCCKFWKCITCTLLLLLYVQRCCHST